MASLDLFNMTGLKNVYKKEWRAIALSIIMCGILLLLQFYRWEIFDGWAIFVMWPLEMAFYLAYFLVILINGILGIRDFRRGRKSTLITTGSMIFIYFLTIVLNFNALWIDHYFSKYRSQRAEVIQMISDGQLKPNVSHDQSQIQLPPPLDKTSMGGGGIFFYSSTSKREVFFFTFRGILDAYAGFYYSSEDLHPGENSMGLEFNDAIKLEPNWYWIGTCNKGKNKALGILLSFVPILRCS